jgi:hypothetical protein
VKKGTSSLHMEMERPFKQVAWSEEKIVVTYAPYCVRSEEDLQWTKYIIILRSGVMETQLELLVTHKNITIHNDFVHMVANLNYTADPCRNISISFSWP